MNRHPWIVWLGGGILGYVAGEMVLKDRLVRLWVGEELMRPLHYLLPTLLGVIITILGWWFAQQHRGRRNIPERT
jgi:predicted tellurium resistance membrane protein TerC